MSQEAEHFFDPRKSLSNVRLLFLTDLDYYSIHLLILSYWKKYYDF